MERGRTQRITKYLVSHVCGSIVQALSRAKRLHERPDAVRSEPEASVLLPGVRRLLSALWPEIIDERERELLCIMLLWRASGAYTQEEVGSPVSRKQAGRL